MSYGFAVLENSSFCSVNSAFFLNGVSRLLSCDVPCRNRNRGKVTGLKSSTCKENYTTTKQNVGEMLQAADVNNLQTPNYKRCCETGDKIPNRRERTTSGIFTSEETSSMVWP